MKKALLIFLFVLWSIASFATNYYFSASGSTSNNGLTTSTTWPLSKVSSATFLPGDSLLFHKGDTFVGTSTLTHSGASGNPIVLDLYGTATNNAVLDGGGSSSSAVIQIKANYITINNLVAQNNTTGNGIIYVPTGGYHDIIFFNLYVNTGIRGFNLVGCGTSGVANIQILHCYSALIADNSSHTNGGGSSIQLNNCGGSGIIIAFNKFYTNMAGSTLGVGDVIDIYQSNGTATSVIWVHDNWIRGGSTHSNGYDGIGLGDVGGSYQLAEKNILVNPGHTGIQLVGGANITCQNNQIYADGSLTGSTQQGISMLNAGGTPSPASWVVQNNKLNWIRASGSVFNWFVGSGSAVTDATVSSSGNGSKTVGEASTNNSILPDPLWTGSPWNTTITLVAPSVKYSPNVVNVTKGTTITSLTPISAAGAPASWSLDKSLPTGMSFNTTTGVVSGTPSVTSSTTSYVATATNGAGSDTAKFTVTVTAATVAPSLSFSPTSNTYTVGSAITSWTVSNSGDAVVGGYSISPALSAGLNFNTVTGAITGTPTAAKTSTTYTVSGSNSAGTGTATVTITVGSNAAVIIKRKIIML
jgi:hypothetical protein